MLFGAPSAPATALFSDSGVACADTGGSCYGACNDGDSNGDGDFDGFMCLTGITAGMWAVRSAYVGAALIWDGWGRDRRKSLGGRSLGRILPDRRDGLLWRRLRYRSARNVEKRLRETRRPVPGAAQDHGVRHGGSHDGGPSAQPRRVETPGVRGLDGCRGPRAVAVRDLGTDSEKPPGVFVGVAVLGSLAPEAAAQGRRVRCEAGVRPGTRSSGCRAVGAPCLEGMAEAAAPIGW